MTSGEYFKHGNFSSDISYQKIEFLLIFHHANYDFENALLSSFLNRFRQTIACWKGLELRNPDTLQLITSCNALHVIPYKKENIAGKTPNISWNIA
jgi:hypothetical protein